MTPKEEKMWKALTTSAEELRRKFIVDEFNRMIKEKIIKISANDADAAIYSAMVKSYYGSEKGDIYDGPRILDYIKNST